MTISDIIRDLLLCPTKIGLESPSANHLKSVNKLIIQNKTPHYDKY